MPWQQLLQHSKHQYHPGKIMASRRKRYTMKVMRFHYLTDCHFHQQGINTTAVPSILTV